MFANAGCIQGAARDEDKTPDWRQENQIDDEFHKYCARFLKMMDEYEALWDRRLSLISITEWIRISAGQEKDRALYPILSLSKCRRIQMIRRQQNVGNESSWTGQTRVGSANCICAEEWWRTQTVVEYGIFNVAAKPNAPQILRMDKCMDSLGYTLLLSISHANNGHWNVETEDPYWYKTAFTSPHRL